MGAVEYPPITKEPNTDARTLTLSDLSPKLPEESHDIRPLDVAGDGMGKDRFESFVMFSPHMILVPHFGTTVNLQTG